MKDSTIRTVLRRLEEKGYLTHEIQGRHSFTEPQTRARALAVRAVKASSIASAAAPPRN